MRLNHVSRDVVNRRGEQFDLARGVQVDEGLKALFHILLLLQLGAREEGAVLGERALEQKCLCLCTLLCEQHRYLCCK